MNVSILAATNASAAFGPTPSLTLNHHLFLDALRLQLLFLP
jgi:hypothetical protein